MTQSSDDPLALCDRLGEAVCASRNGAYTRTTDECAVVAARMSSPLEAEVWAKATGILEKVYRLALAEADRDDDACMSAREALNDTVIRLSEEITWVRARAKETP